MVRSLTVGPADAVVLDAAAAELTTALAMGRPANAESSATRRGPET
jgi:hypothetical protein